MLARRLAMSGSGTIMNTEPHQRRLRKTPPPPSPLLRLPAELRLIIYSYAYDRTLRFWLSFSNDQLHYRRPIGKLQKKVLIKKEDHHRAALLRTCKLIACEAGPLFYASIEISVFFYDLKVPCHNNRWRTMSMEQLQQLAERVSKVELKYSLVSAKDRDESVAFILVFIQGLRRLKAIKPMIFGPGIFVIERETKVVQKSASVEERDRENGNEDEDEDGVIYNTLQELKEYMSEFLDYKLS